MTDSPGFSDEIDIPKPPEGWWEQVPVLHELYKLLSSNEPVNWELARQVGIALASYDEAGVVDPAGQGEWVEASLETGREGMNPLAGELMLGGDRELAGQAAQVRSQISGVFMGLQTGFVLGYMGRHVIGQYELPLPAPSPPRLLYVMS